MLDGLKLWRVKFAIQFHPIPCVIPLMHDISNATFYLCYAVNHWFQFQIIRPHTNKLSPVGHHEISHYQKSVLSKIRKCPNSYNPRTKSVLSKIWKYHVLQFKDEIFGIVVVSFSLWMVVAVLLIGRWDDVLMCRFSLHDNGSELLTTAER